MFLFRKKVRAKSIKHPLSTLAERKTDEEIAELALRLQNKDDSVVGEIVKAFIGLAINIAGQYATRVPNKESDLVAEAMIAIVEGCRILMDTGQPIDNIGAYLVYRMHYNIGLFLKRDQLIKIPLYEKKEGLKLDGILNGLRDKLKPRPDSNLFEIMESIEKSMISDEERIVIQLRSFGYKDPEIAAKLGLSVSRVNELKLKVRKRFRKLR